MVGSEARFTGRGASRMYCEQFCGGVPVWEVEFFIAPGGVDSVAASSSSPSLVRKREADELMEQARAARDDGEPRRAYLLAERAYTTYLLLPTLLFLGELRLREMNEPQARAAAWQPADAMLATLYPYCSGHARHARTGPVPRPLAAPTVSSKTARGHSVLTVSSRARSLPPPRSTRCFA